MKETVAAFAEQVDVLAAWLDALSDSDFERPCVLAGWDVRTLLGHVVMVRRGLAQVLATRSDQAPVPAADYVRCYRPDATDIAGRTVATTGSRAPRELIASLREPLALDEVADRAVLAGRRGPITA